MELLRPSSRLIILSTLSTLTMWLGQGCAVVDNDRTTIGGDEVPALRGHAQRGGTGATAADGPSLVAGSRDHWENAPIVVPIDGTKHHPHYTPAQPNYSSSTRSRGAYPTAESSLTLGSDAGLQAWEMIAAPFHGAADVVLFLPRAVLMPPGSVMSSPVDAMERHRDGTEVSPALVPEAAPITQAGTDGGR